MDKLEMVGYLVALAERLTDIYEHCDDEAARVDLLEVIQDMSETARKMESEFEEVPKEQISMF